ncbi:MAG: hypothetical protein RIC55_17985 [Pirellulaceae bacterium]
MTKHLLPCPKCDADLTIDVGQAGQTISCGECHAEVEVPTMRGIRGLPTVAGSSSLGSAEPQWSRRQGILFATGLPVLVVALGVATYLLYLRSLVDTSRPDDRLRATEEVKIDQMTPLEVWGIWQQVRDLRLQRLEIPQHEKNRRYAQNLFIFAMISVGVSVLGLGTMILSFFLRSPPDGKKPAPPRAQK